MSKLKHTPGPWNIDSSVSTTEICTVYGLPTGWSSIHAPESCGISEKEQLSNARLIAAAPEMLEILKKVQSAVNDEMQFQVSFEVDEIIKKVEADDEL